MVIEHLWSWIGFTAFVLAMLAIDLGVFHHKVHAVSFKEASIWSGVWITLALIFNAGLYLFRGAEPAVQFFTGYVIEKALSVDNIFVFVLIFTYFHVPATYQHRVLFWGVLGALVMRGILIVVGATLLGMFHWIMYVFGAFLVVTGIKMALQREMNLRPEDNPVIKLVRRIIPITSTYEDERFFVRHARQLMATPLLLVLLIVESTDLIFATDSIPAVFAVTQDPFLVYTSNVFAILGLRSLYFVFAKVIDTFIYLRFGLAAILTYVGGKMLLADISPVPTSLSLGIIAVILATAIIASVIKTRQRKPQRSTSPVENSEQKEISHKHLLLYNEKQRERKECRSSPKESTR
jgi:tellurite resistance protein TerC